MDFYNVIENRLSYKKFSTERIDRDSLHRMINSAMRSPSYKNHTSYKIIIVEDEGLKRELSGCILNSTSEMSNAVLDAPVTCVVIGRPEESGQMDGKDFYLIDGAIAMEHFVLSAAAEGYGTCWVTSFNEETIKTILNIPQEFKIIALTPVGRPAEHREPHQKKDVRDYVFMNEYNEPFTENDLKLK